MRGAPEVRSLFAGRYRVLSTLGQGGMGMVLHVHDEREGRECALKLMRPHLDRLSDLARFERELRATARLDHPHCVRCFDHGVDQGRPFLVMEYVEGGPLAIERWDDPAQIVDLARQLLCGLDHIHAHGLIHRDLKPQNVFVDRRAGHLRARLGDLGVVKVADFRDDEVGVGEVIGSLQFLAPESFEHGTVDPRSDLYALGLLLHCLLMGEHPLGQGKVSARQWLNLHRRGVVQPIDRPDVPEALVAVVERLHARWPERRFASAAAAHDALDDVVGDIGSGYRWARPPPLQRRPLLVAPALVGRDDELLQATRFLERLEAGTEGPCMLWIEGAAGQGKSRLLRELLARALDHEVLAFTGTCPAEGAPPYQPLGELMKALGKVDGQSAEAMSHSLRTTRAPTDEPRRPIPLALTATLGLDHGHLELADTLDRDRPVLSELNPEDQALARLHVHERLTARLATLCADAPVLVVVEDAQWSDASSMQLLSSMASTVMQERARGRAWPVGFVVTHRPLRGDERPAEARKALRRSGAGEAIVLGPLSDRSATALVASMLMVEPSQVPENFARPLLATAEGSPLFLSQVMRLLLTQGVIGVDARGRWHLDARRLERAPLPATVGLAIGERAARLATPSKHLLVAAAAVGRTFDLGVVSAIIDEDELAVVDGLDELLGAEFIEDAPGGYRFVHDRIREAIYGTLSSRGRRTLHTSIAIALEERDGTDPSAWPAIAHHFEQAHEHERAYRYALDAADRASAAYAHADADAMYELALRVAARSDTLVVSHEVWERRADACTALGHYAEAVDSYRRCLHAASSALERRVLLTKMGTLEYKRGRFREAVAVMERATEMAGFEPPRSAWDLRRRTLVQAVRAVLPARPWRGTAADGDAQVRGFALMAESSYFHCDQVRSIYYSMLSANTARQVGPCPASVRALAGFSFTLAIVGLHRAADRHMAMARGFGQRVELPDSDAGWIVAMSGINLATQGRGHEALALFERTADRFENSPNVEALQHNLSSHVFVRIAVGRDLPRADRICARLRRVSEEAGDARMVAVTREVEAQLMLRRGQIDRGLGSMKDAARACEAVHDMTFFTRANDTLALFLALQGRCDEALEHGRVAARIALEGRLRHFVPVDGGLVVAAAMARRRGRRLSLGVEMMVRRVLLTRRWVVAASRLTSLRFALGQAAWACVHGRAFDFDGVIERARRAGFAGEAWIGHRVAAAFVPGDRERHRQGWEELGRAFEHK